ncbi:hypothetical protein ACFPU1_16670 [Thalassorhabdus alkalitolerans]|uniref:DUF4760 domain-containing protein n=1 Tax=Thalassorhabdus alkalitolerans TaxID=2282697 RepID=A0ABW0YRH5_9BACI
MENLILLGAAAFGAFIYMFIDKTLLPLIVKLISQWQKFKGDKALQEEQFQFEMHQEARRNNFEINLHLERRLREEIFPTLYEKFLIASSFAYHNKINVTERKMKENMHRSFWEAKNYWVTIEVFIKNDNDLRDLINNMVKNLADNYQQWALPRNIRNTAKMTSLEKDNEKQVENLLKLLQERIYKEYNQVNSTPKKENE